MTRGLGHLVVNAIVEFSVCSQHSPYLFLFDINLWACMKFSNKIPCQPSTDCISSPNKVFIDWLGLVGAWCALLWGYSVPRSSTLRASLILLFWQTGNWPCRGLHLPPQLPLALSPKLEGAGQLALWRELAGEASCHPGNSAYFRGTSNCSVCDYF